LNAFKRVGARSHIPYLLGAWGMSKFSLGKCVSQQRKPKERKFIWGVTTVLDDSICMHAQQLESKKEIFEIEHPWKAKSRACWSVFGSFWKERMKSRVVNHEE
jgi:hypothetical protein